MTCEEFAPLIDDYVDDALTEKQKEAFEEHYFQCDHCYVELKLRERLDSKEIPILLKKKKRFLALKPALAFATLLLLATSSILVFRGIDRSRALREISAFQPPVYIESETRNPLLNEKFASAMAYYSKKDFPRARELLAEIERDRARQRQSPNPQVIFFLGITHLLNGQNRGAVARFDAIIDMMNPSYYDEAIYYRAIALLRLNRKREALDALHHLSEMFSPYAPRARELIEKVKALR